MRVFQLGNVLNLSWGTFSTGICIFAHKALHVFLYHQANVSGMIVIMIGDAVNKQGSHCDSCFL